MHVVALADYEPADVILRRQRERNRARGVGRGRGEHGGEIPFQHRHARALDGLAGGHREDRRVQPSVRPFPQHAEIGELDERLRAGPLLAGFGPGERLAFHGQENHAGLLSAEDVGPIHERLLAGVEHRARQRHGALGERRRFDQAGWERLVKFVGRVFILRPLFRVFGERLDGLRRCLRGDELRGDADALEVHAADGKLARAAAELVGGDRGQIQARLDRREAKGAGARAGQRLERLAEERGIDLQLVFHAALEIAANDERFVVRLEAHLRDGRGDAEKLPGGLFAHVRCEFLGELEREAAPGVHVALGHELVQSERLHPSQHRYARLGDLEVSDARLDPWPHLQAPERTGRERLGGGDDEPVRLRQLGVLVFVLRLLRAGWLVRFFPPLVPILRVVGNREVILAQRVAHGRRDLAPVVGDKGEELCCALEFHFEVESDLLHGPRRGRPVFVARRHSGGNLERRRLQHLREIGAELRARGVGEPGAERHPVGRPQRGRSRRRIHAAPRAQPRELPRQRRRKHQRRIFHHHADLLRRHHGPREPHLDGARRLQRIAFHDQFHLRRFGGEDGADEEKENAEGVQEFHKEQPVEVKRGGGSQPHR